MCPTRCALLALLTAFTAAHAQTVTRTLEIAAPEQDRANAVVSVPWVVPDALVNGVVTAKDDAGRDCPAQLTVLDLFGPMFKLAAGFMGRQLVVIVPKVEKGKALKVTVTLSAGQPTGEPLRWVDEGKAYSELRRGERPLVRYMRTPLDNSTKAQRDLTYKVFHHVFDPTGKVLLTKGPGGQFTHHRGIFFGFNRVTYDDTKKVDIWHCPVAWQADAGTLRAEGGPLVGRQQVAIDWHGLGQDIFAKERRDLQIIELPGGLLIEWSTLLTSTGPTIKLDGDPQHAGFHYRAAGEVADKTKSQTYYVRPDGKDAPGKTRNWPGQKQHANLAWDAMSFVVADQRYTVVYLDRPQNPKEARFSERDYGRFGSYFEYTLTPTKPLELRYRLWVQPGEMTVEQAAALSTDFVTPLSVR